MGYFTNLHHRLEKYLEPAQIAIVEQAYVVAREAHRGQKRLSGEPYITHPVEVAIILAKMRMDYQSIIAALLHDVIEDTDISKEEIAEQFSEEVAELVDGVSKLKQITYASRAELQAEYFRKMVLAMVRDIRVIIVKLADRLHNMRTISYMSPKKRRRIAIETLDIYAPIAKRLGIHKFYVELEDLGFQARYPMRFRILNDAIEKAITNRKQMVVDIENKLTAAFKQHNIEIKAIYDRQKHIYSIYKKMRNNRRTSFSDIMDVYGFRIIVESIEACYRVLGVVHSLYKPRQERFKDYIAIPKANGYQSLHTTLLGPSGAPIEIQIRTMHMEKIAENGVAAHWKYKTFDLDEEKQELRDHAWVKSLMAIQENTGSSLEFIENVKTDLFPDEVYVFTPKGKIMELPKGSTPVDFAYAIHSDIGNKCVGAKIDRRLVPLSTRLANGQTVEIITALDAFPNPTWLNFAETGKARSNIRHFLKTQQQTESTVLGQRLLNKALQDLSSSLDSISDAQLKEVTEALQYKNFDNLCAAIGLGNEMAMVVAKRLLNELPNDVIEMPVMADRQPLVIKGTEGMVLNFAECCRPVPGDPIVGILQPGVGIMVHIENCRHIAKLLGKPDCFVPMSWEDNVKGEFKVDIAIEVVNQRGVLALLASAIADAEANIDNVTVDPRDGRYNIVRLTLSVQNRVHLARIMRRIRSLKPVMRLTRSKR